MIEIKDLCVELGPFVINGLNLSIEEGSFFGILGPTGAGKTVLLEAVAGLVPVKSGSVLVGGKDITGLPPEKRGIGIVYQDYSLFPNMNVKENIRFGLKYHRREEDAARERFHELAEKLRISPILHRMPATLSGGELQRVAIARSLMIEPSVLLLDEPLSAIDPLLRGELQMMLKELHGASGTTFVLVTHNFSEALSLCQKAAVMNNGTLEQAGNIRDLFAKPETGFVAGFVGMKNIFPANFKKGRADTEGLTIFTGGERDSGNGFIAIRPEDIVISRKRISSSMRNSFMARVGVVIDMGFIYEIHLSVGENLFKSHITKGALSEMEISSGDSVYLSFKATAVHCF